MLFCRKLHNINTRSTFNTSHSYKHKPPTKDYLKTYLVRQEETAHTPSSRSPKLSLRLPKIGLFPFH